MGIKFRCPNGHKVHVKAYLAGKRCKCPKCGAKVRVPKESVPPSGASPDDSPAELDETDLGGIDDELPPEISTPSAPADPQMNDPLAVWYVNLPSGKQMGPAGGRELQGWLQEGAITSAALIWRDGWPEWQPVARVFPRHIGSAPAAGPLVIPTETDFSVGPPGPSVSMYTRRRRRRLPASLTLFLMMLVVVLFAVLMWVFVLRE